MSRKHRRKERRTFPELMHLIFLLAKSNLTSETCKIQFVWSLGLSNHFICQKLSLLKCEKPYHHFLLVLTTHVDV